MRWKPEFRCTQSRSGYVVVTLQQNLAADGLSIMTNQIDGMNSLFHKLIHMLAVGDVELHSTSLVFAMFLDKRIQSVLSTAYCDDLGTFLDESISQCSTYARSGAHEKDASVLERH